MHPFNPSTATRFFLAFLLLFIILFSLSNLLFLKLFMPQFEEELEAYNLQILTNTKTAADEYIFSKAEEEYMSVLLSGNEKDYFYPLVQNPAENLWRPLNSINQLKETVSYTEDFFHSISLYFPEKNFILSSAGFKFLNNENNTNILEFPWQIELKNLSYGGTAWFLSKAVADYNEIPYKYTPVLVFTGTYPPHSKTADCLAHIVLEIPLSRVDRFIHQYEGLSEGNFWITYKNNVIYSMGEDSSLEKESISYIQSSVSSRFEGIEYHYALLESVLFSKTIRIRNNLYLLMGVSLILSLIFSWFAAKIMVRPIDNIAHTARTLMDKLNFNGPPSDGNELDDIGTTLTLLAGRLEQSMPVMKSSFFTHLVRGELRDEQIDKQSIIYGFSHEYDFFQTAIIQIKGERSRINLLAVQLLILLQEKSEDFFYPFPFGADKIVIAAGWDTPDLFMEFCLETYDAFKKKSGIDEGDVIIAIGKPVNHLAQLNNSFDSALKRLPRYFLFGGPLLEASDSSEMVPLILPSSSRWGEVLSSGDREALVELFDDVKESLRQTNMDMDGIQLELNSLSETIKSLLSRDGFIFQGKDFLNPHISRFNYLADMFALWINDIMWFNAKRDQNREDLNNRVIDDIKGYINQNYMNEISLSELSERFNISYSHLSKLFHTFSGVTFRTYLLNYRLEKAAQFLMESRESVKEIAYNTGFRDTGYFIKQFKRHFGSTPSNYRKSGSSYGNS